MSRVFGDPDRLEAFTAELSPSIGPTVDEVEGYGAAVRALNAAGPNDLGTHLTDLSPAVLAELELLRELDRAPAAFAFALRNIDHLRTDRADRLQFTDVDRFDALATAWLQDPYGSRRDLIAAAAGTLETGPILPWDERGSWAADPTSPSWWAATSIGAAERTVKEVWTRLGVDVRGHYRAGTRVDAYGRWRPGEAGRLNPRIGSADRWREALPWARRVGRGLPGVPGVVQYLEDRDDANLTTGDRVARSGSAALLEGGGAFVGGAGGAKAGALAGAVIGTAVLPGLGTAVGGTIGAIAGGVGGGFLGAEAGGFVKDNAQGAISAIGGAIDRGIDKVTDVGGSVVSSVKGWFGR